MFTYEVGERIGEGSNSYIHECYFNEMSVVAKIPKVKNRYISFNLQVDAMKYINNMDRKFDFEIPKIYYYTNNDKRYGEILILEKMNNIYPIDFILRKNIVDYELIITKIAEAIAVLHSISISGYDVEFYWDLVKNKLVLLDIGQRYTIGVTTEEMLVRTIELESTNESGMWNIISCILERKTAIEVYESNTIGEVTFKELLKEINFNSVLLHIEDVAKSHYIQIIGSINKIFHSRATKLFVRIYKQKLVSTIGIQNMIYINNFEKSFQVNIRNCVVKLYYSNSDTLSIISNSNTIN